MLTVLTTLIAGAVQQGVNPFQRGFPYLHVAALSTGLPFSLTLLTILLTHEFAHYFFSKRHRVPTSLPYFIPAPTFIGTFGAFIRMHAPISRKSALFDIGASGPLAGFLVALVAVAVGLKLSLIVRAEEAGALQLGSPLIFSFISELVLGHIPDNADVLLHPIAFAGWLGLFVTSLNLIPIGQLDGGHIAYAFLGARQRTLSLVMVGILLVLGWPEWGWPGWWVWAAIAGIFGVRHPPVLDTDTPLDPRRKLLAWLTLLVFLISFIPRPFELS